MIYGFSSLLKCTPTKIKSFFFNLLTNTTIINIIIVGFVNVFVKGSGFLKESIVAKHFGLAMLLDTFYIAVLIPSFINNVFVDSLSNIFIPNYITELKTSNNKGAFQSFSFILVTVIAFFSLLLSTLLTTTFLHVIYKGHTSNYYYLIIVQFKYIAPSLFFWGFSSLLSALLVVHNKFFITTLYPIFTTFSILISIYFKNQLGVPVLAIGMLGGSILEFLFLLTCALYFKELKFELPRINPNLKLMIKQLPAKVSSGFLIGMNNFVDQFFAAQLVIGSITAINYGVKIPSFIAGILVMALGNVLLPYFSKEVNEDIKKAFNSLFRILKAAFIATSVFVTFIFIFSNKLIYYAFQRGRFTGSDTVIVSDIQRIFLVYIPFYVCSMILVKFLTSINKNNLMAWVSLLSLILNFVLDIVFIKPFGLYGLALSTTIVYIVNCVALLIFAINQKKQCVI